MGLVASNILIVLSLLLFFINLVLWFVIPDFYIINSLSSVFCLLVFAFGLYLNEDIKKRYFVRSVFFKIANMIIQVMLFLFILLLINFLSVKRPFLWDLSKDKVSTLSSYSKKVLSKVERPIQFYVFSEMEQKQGILSLLELYRIESSYTNYEYFNPDYNPSMIKKYKIQKVPTVLVKQGERFFKVEEIVESELTTSINKILREDRPIVTFLSGAGNDLLLSEDKNGYSKIIENLKNENFDVKVLDYLTSKEEIRKSEIIILFDPVRILREEEVAFLDELVKMKKKIIYATGPSFNNNRQVELNEFLMKRNILMLNSVAIDLSSNVNGSNGLAPVFKSLNSDFGFTKNLTGAIFFPLARGLYKENNNKRYEYIPLSKTSNFPESWADTSVVQGVETQYTYQSDTDIAGPIDTMVLIRDKEKKEGDIIVIGNASFVANQYEQHGGNFSLFVNMAHFLDSGNEFVSDYAVKENPSVFLSKDEINLSFVLFVFIYPLLFLGYGIYITRRRMIA